jgi:hypothetical protein
MLTTRASNLLFMASAPRNSEAFINRIPLEFLPPIVEQRAQDNSPPRSLGVTLQFSHKHHEVDEASLSAKSLSTYCRIWMFGFRGY